MSSIHPDTLNQMSNYVHRATPYVRDHEFATFFASTTPDFSAATTPDIADTAQTTQDVVERIFCVILNTHQRINCHYFNNQQAHYNFITQLYAQGYRDVTAQIP